MHCFSSAPRRFFPSKFEFASFFFPPISTELTFTGTAPPSDVAWRSTHFFFCSLLSSSFSSSRLSDRRRDATNGMSASSVEMFNKASFLTRLVASSVRVSETAGGIIKNVMAGGDLKIIDKAEQGSGYDPQTEADRRAQFCIVQSLQQRFKNINIIGEEDDTTACPELESGFSEDVLLTDRLLSNELREIKESEVVVWVDPLDGTSEVALAVKNKNLALLEQVTVLIGVAYKGRPVAGIIHQPYHADNGRTVWAIRGCGVHGLAPATENTKKIVVTTRSHLSESVSSALDALKHQNLADSVEKVGGAGFKVLKVLEGCAAYVFASAGCKKWDTCAVEAVLSAAGGRLTDISGRDIRYEPDVQVNNTGGVLATASWVAHQEYINTIPQEIKNNLPEIVSKK